MQIVELEMVPLSLRPVLQRLYDMKTTQSALREGVLFSTKRNNYYYDTGTGKVIVLDDDTSYIFRVLFDPTLSAETFLISLTKVDPNAVKISKRLIQPVCEKGYQQYFKILLSIRLLRKKI